MGCALNNLDCLEPFRLWEQCNAKGIPTDSWLGKANSYRCPLGMDAGRAYVLIRKEQLNDLYLSGVGHTITFTSPDQPAIVLKGFSIVRATAIIPSQQNDLNMPFLVELADKRHLFKMTTIDKSYNVRSTPGSETFYPNSLNGGLKWSWQGMVTDIWEHAVLTFQTGIALPFAPMPFPEEFKFWGMYAWDALGIVLDRLGCALKYDPTLDVDPFTIVRIGVDDAAEAAGEVLYNDRRLWDEYPIEPAKGRIPQFVRVQFLKQPQQAGTSPWLTKDETDTSTDPTPIEDVELGSTFIVKDDLPALYDSNGTLTNDADLETRAEERAADVFRQLKKGSTRLVKVFKGALSDAGLLPGPRIKATAWEDRGVAGKTEIYRGPDIAPPAGTFDIVLADGTTNQTNNTNTEDSGIVPWTVLRNLSGWSGSGTADITHGVSFNYIIAPNGNVVGEYTNLHPGVMIRRSGALTFSPLQAGGRIITFPYMWHEATHLTHIGVVHQNVGIQSWSVGIYDNIEPASHDYLYPNQLLASGNPASFNAETPPPFGLNARMVPVNVDVEPNSVYWFALLGLTNTASLLAVNEGDVEGVYGLKLVNTGASPIMFYPGIGINAIHASGPLPATYPKRVPPSNSVDMMPALAALSIQPIVVYRKGN